MVNIVYENKLARLHFSNVLQLQVHHRVNFAFSYIQKYYTNDILLSKCYESIIIYILIQSYLSKQIALAVN